MVCPSWGNITNRWCRIAWIKCATRSCVSICYNRISSVSNLVFCHGYPTGACVSGKTIERCRWGAKPPGQRNLSLRAGHSTVRSSGDCQHQGGWEQGWGGMVNICEPLLNVVTRNKPKMLTGLNQKGKGSGTGAIKSSVADVAPSAKRRNLTHL